MNQLVAPVSHQLEIPAHRFDELGAAESSKRELETVRRTFLLLNIFPGVLDNFTPVYFNHLTEHFLADALSLLLQVSLEGFRCTT